ncbi:hypothetical protein [Cognatitamlana onchidii]|uniref:hypothetical protein n=1 Tax=Cognatitamlana onchidii TaxID=2562860 RepID=UPI0010A63B79|nr:hypothetical protein [Algibacter onchidii]
MNIIKYNSFNRPNKGIDYYLKSYYFSKMPYTASELLDKGVPSKDIINAVKEAIRVMVLLDVDTEKHVSKFYSQYKGLLFKDCKLSELAYALVLLNLNNETMYAANIQLTIAEYFLKEYDMRKF